MSTFLERTIKVTLSNRPDLCEYQCNGAMAGAKAYKKAPFMIAEDVVALLKDSACMEEVEVVKPGFINIRLKKSFVADYLNQMEETDNLGMSEKDRTSGDDRAGLWRTKCGKAVACRTSPFGDHRRKRKAHLKKDGT